MAGYVATERIVQARPRFVASDLGWSGRDVLTEGSDRSATTGSTESRPLDERFHHALEDLRETWAQTTFFLFDPDSWR